MSFHGQIPETVHSTVSMIHGGKSTHYNHEIIQEIILFALWQVNFFEVAAFQGGTSLRVLHGLSRFSEDIDFILLKPDTDFSWQP